MPQARTGGQARQSGRQTARPARQPAESGPESEAESEARQAAKRATRPAGRPAAPSAARPAAPSAARPAAPSAARPAAPSAARPAAPSAARPAASSAAKPAARPVNTARKVVGVGSVGTRCWIILMLGRDEKDPLFLQVKEAQPSVLSPYLGASKYANQGERVVAGQRLMQAASDIFLGWQRTTGLDGQYRDFYVRQLRDWKFSFPIEVMVPRGMRIYAAVCGGTLARAHARSGTGSPSPPTSAAPMFSIARSPTSPPPTPTRTSATTTHSPRPQPPDGWPPSLRCDQPACGARPACGPP